MTGRSPRGRLYAGTARRDGPDSLEPDDAVRPDDPEPEDALESPLGALPPPLRGVAVPDVVLPDDRVRPDCSPYLTGGRLEPIVEGIDDEDEEAVQPELATLLPLETSPLGATTLLPAEPPPPPSRGVADPPPPSLRGTADPVVLPFDVTLLSGSQP